MIGSGRNGSALLAAHDVSKHFEKASGAWGGGDGVTVAVDRVSLKVAAQESVAIVGESGCGKSTLALLLAGLERPTSGQVQHRGVDLWSLSARERREQQGRTQIVFQDPDSAINPRWTVREIVSEPLRIHGRYDRRGEQVVPLLEQVGLNASHVGRYPHQLSGGQKQRVNIARALALGPDLLILDEPVSALDLSVQAQVVDLLQRLQRELGLAFVMISHDLSVVRQLCDRIHVMYVGEVVESGATADVLTHPFHPYTASLIESAPVWHPSERDRPRRLLEGDVPDPSNPPSGCRFRTRCWKAQERCAEEAPALRPSEDHRVACHFPELPDSEGQKL